MLSLNQNPHKVRDPATCTMSKICGFTALFVFLLSAGFHIATFIPAISVSMQIAWPLHLAALVVFGFMVFSLVAKQQRQKKEPVKGSLRFGVRNAGQSKAFLAQEIGSAPRAMRIACVTTFIYAIINFAFFLILMEGGGPEAKKGTFYLETHGQEIREITKEEYHRFRAYEVRGFSGHWMLFSLFSTTYFLAVYPKPHRQETKL